MSKIQSIIRKIIICVIGSMEIMCFGYFLKSPLIINLLKSYLIKKKQNTFKNLTHQLEWITKIFDRFCILSWCKTELYLAFKFFSDY